MTDFFTGKIRWFSIRQGYGFIQPDGYGKDVYFRTEGVKDLIPLQRVRYQIRNRRDKVSAVNIEAI